MHGSPWLAVSPLDDIPLVILLPPHHQHHKNLCSVCVCVRACLTMSLVCAAVCESERMLVCMYVTVFLQALALATITFDGYLLWLWRAVCFPVDDSWGF